MDMLETWLESLGKFTLVRLLPAMGLLVAGILAVQIILRIITVALQRSNLEKAAHTLIRSTVRIALYLVLFLVLGCLSDPNVNIMVFVPMILPLIAKAGLDPIHAGIVIIINAMIGNITPPVGVVLMTTCALEGLKIEAVVKELWPWIILLFAFLLFLIVCPQVVLFLPSLMG